MSGCKRRFLHVLVAIIAILCALSTSRAQSLHDDFEGATLSPLWSVYTQSGNASLSSGGPVHGGSQALQLSSTNTGQDKYIYLRHTFPAPTYGRASVWVYDTGANYSSSNYIAFALEDTQFNGGSYVDWIGTYDYNLGPGQGGSFYYYIAGLTGINYPGTVRTQGWHQWVLDSQPNSFTASVDGTVIYSDAGGRPFDRIALSLSGPSWRPAWTTYFDDFDFVPTPSYSVCPLYDQTKAVKSGATIPIKLQVRDGGGANLSSPSLAVHATGVTQVSSLAPGTLQDAGNANPDFDFRYDATIGGTGGYVFNLKTTGYGTGTYQLNFTIGGGTTTYSVQFCVR